MIKKLFITVSIVFCALPMMAQTALKAGTYYIQNAQSGTWLSSGATWATHSVLSPHGIDVNVTVSNNQYKLTTRLMDNAGALRATDAFMDCTDGTLTWTIQALDDGCYALFNGTNYLGYDPESTTPWIVTIDHYYYSTKIGTHWKFWTKDQLKATLNDATLTKPVDATFLIQAPDFIYGDHRIFTDKCWGENIETTSGIRESSNTVRNCSNGEQWNKASFDINQTLKGIPDGVYTLKAQALYRFGSNADAATAYRTKRESVKAWFYAGNKQKQVHSVFDFATKTASGGFSTSTTAGYVPNSQGDAAKIFNANDANYENVLEHIIVKGGVLRIGFRKPEYELFDDWCCFDNLTLLYYGNSIEAYQDAAKAELARYETLNEKADADFAAKLAAADAKVDAATTAEDVELAVQDMQTAYGQYLSNVEVENVAVDLSAAINNADFSQAGAFWNTTAERAANATIDLTYLSTTIPAVGEAYAGYNFMEISKYSYTQKIGLAPGMYRLTGQAFYRYGLNYNSDLEKDGTPRSFAYLFAGNDTVKVARLGSIAASAYANSLSEASGTFKNGLYKNTIIFTLEEPTEIEIGYCGTHPDIRSWFCFGPFKLEKINEDVLYYERAKEFEATKTQYVNNWNQLLKIANQAVDPSSFEEKLEASKTALAGVRTYEALDAEDTKVHEALRDLLKSGKAKNGLFDITSLVVNPSFDANINGWESKNTLAWNAAGMTEEFNGGDSEFKQMLKSMPAGKYTVKVQAFYRQGNWQATVANYEQGNPYENTAELFFGDKSMTIKCIYDDVIYNSIRPSSDIGGPFGTSMPNSIGGAWAAFNSGLYWNILQTELTEDSNVEIGLRSIRKHSTWWLPFDNFRVYYGAERPKITIDDTQDFSIAEDTYADVTTNISLKAGQLNSICVPFDLTADKFAGAYQLAGVKYDSENQTATGTLVPVSNLKAGHTYFVKVNSDQMLEAENVLVHASLPDSVPVMWENAATTGVYAPTTLRKIYKLNDEGTALSYNSYVLHQPGMHGFAYIPATISNKVKDINLEIIDFNNVDFSVNLENYQARAFLATAKYADASTSVIDRYNGMPPGRKDQPHTVMVPLPLGCEGATVRYSMKEDMSSYETRKALNDALWCELPNLIPQVTYYFQVVSDNNVVAKGKFTTEGNLRMIKVPTGSNVRDLGGWTTSTGKKVHYGLIYRGGEMNGAHALNQADIDELRRVGIKAEVDLRSDNDTGNYNLDGSALGKDIAYIYINQYIFGDDALKQDTGKYKDIFTFILKELRQNHPVYFHCVWGADRTGALGFLLEGLLGVPIDQIYKDYEFTSYSIAGARPKSGLDTKVTYIRSLAGNTLQEKFFNYWKNNVGITSADLNKFITIMTGSTDPLAIDALEEDEEILTTNYYTLDGTMHAAPQRGINIIRQTDSKGNVKTKKMFVK